MGHNHLIDRTILALAQCCQYFYPLLAVCSQNESLHGPAHQTL